MTGVDAVSRRAGAACSALPLLVFLFLAATCDSRAVAADGPNACGSPIAHVVSLQGSIELRRAGQNTWAKVSRLDTPVCEGDRLRTGALSRTALFIQPETLVRVDQNTSISVSQTKEETLVEFTQEEVVTVSTTPYTCGAGYFITRFPRKFKVNTPHLNAAVEGTEFLVALRCESTELSVFEGKVLAEGVGPYAFDAQSISSGQTLSIGGAEPPAIKLLVKPTDAVQWTLYYPPITPAGAVPAEDCRLVPLDSRAACLIARAEHLLRSGRVEEAQANIADALAASPLSSDALALSSIISLVRNDKAEALRLAKEAITANSLSAPAWLAQSYAQQADFKLDAALVSARRASELTPTSALAHARVAELQLSLGRTREAEKTARQAVEANPSESRAHMILGFVHLAQINVKAAREDFGRAIENDSTDPLSRLGLGLAIIREGKLREGREQIEIAVALDPTNSLLRSYVGKAYYEENTRERDELASTQFSLARQLDPQDPTPWLYGSILKQTQNKAVEALMDVEKSVALNANRAVDRSRLFIDDDLATRAANNGRVFSDLGFKDLALHAASRALAADPSSYAAHRFLADAYLSQPRHNAARQSELLQAQLRQPVSLMPLQPQLTEDRFVVLRDTGPSASTLTEFTPLFKQDGSALQAGGVTGSHGTKGSEVVLAKLNGPWSLGVGRLTYETDGFSTNKGFRKEVFNVFAQRQISDVFNLQIEVRDSATVLGDTALRFDPLLTIPFEDDLESQSIRLGATVRLANHSEFLLSAVQVDSLQAVTFSGIPIVEQDFLTDLVELQYTLRGDFWSVISGAGYHTEKKTISSFGTQTKTKPDATSAYLYTTVSPWDDVLAFQLGASAEKFDSIEDPNTTRSHIYPKIGLTARLSSNANIRAAWFKSLKRKFFSNQTLEPTQVAGFNQLFDDFDGTKSERTGVGLDYRFFDTAVLGVEKTMRNMEVPQEGTKETFFWRERGTRAYLYWFAFPRFVIAANFNLEDLKRPIEFPGTELFLHARTTQTSLSGKFFMNDSVLSYITVTHVDQLGLFFDSSFNPDPSPGSSSFWNVDFGMSFRLPERSGLFAFEIRNAFDRTFRYQETDMTTTTFARDRFLLARVTLIW
jgi:tetratricopeptide (TPR) repeat protein